MDVAKARPRVIRILVNVETDLARDQIKHTYLRGATALRLDIAQ
jgi:chorismate mutase